MYMKKKHHRKSSRRNLESMHVLFVICTHVKTLHSCYNFALMLHENALIFNQSERHNFFTFTIKSAIIP